MIFHASKIVSPYEPFHIYRVDTPAHNQRVQQVLKEIEDKGTYEIDAKELVFGAKLAWRNAPRCVGRIQWNKLQVREMNLCMKNGHQGIAKAKLTYFVIYRSRNQSKLTSIALSSKFLRLREVEQFFAVGTHSFANNIAKI